MFRSERLSSAFAVVAVVLLPLAIVTRSPAADQPPAVRSAAAPADRSAAAAKGSHSNRGGDDWPCFLGPNHDGTSSEIGIRTDWSGDRLPVLWTRELGTSYGIGSVADGRYFQFDRIEDEERLTCLDARTGEEIWSHGQSVQYEDMYGYNNGPRSSPAIDGDAVYTMGVAGRLTCRSVSDGALRWSVDTHDRYGVVQNFFGVGCSPLIHGNAVIVMVGGSPPEDQNLPPGRLDRVIPNGSALVAFDKQTGQELYRVGEYLASYSTPRPFRVGDTTLILAFVREGLLAIDPQTGKEAWFVPWRSRKLESVNGAVPLVRGDEILISECYEIGSLLLRAGRDGYEILRQDPRNPRQQSFRAHWATPIQVGGAVYGTSGRNAPDSDLRCIDWETGELRWSDPRRQRSSLLGVDGHLVVLDERGTLELIRATPEAYASVTSIDLSQPHPAAGGEPLLSYPCWAAPILAQGLMYVRGPDRVVCFELIPGAAGE
ncbi:outer membrane protein assembly factor BamB family protein [Candidatus Laterigemmans baculatus]|uniref:outer membrane protein assembly factor BamB family protein n=1 Tax=Candidatus Laterigemmans baculatus TaxID=2770505 RepID=UPI0013D9FD81|nr:PQQ-binding-like beta-propeller repeat protein [Candidatus Laterigemmans baculatus]